ETVSDEPETVSDEPETVSDEPETVSDEAETVSDEPETVSDEAETVSDESEPEEVNATNDPVDNLVAVLRSKEDWEQIMCGVDLMIKNLFLKPCDGKLILDQEETKAYANFLILKTYISEALKK
ncbi:MAG: hypothetical protein KKA81_08340, partial [Bacteroidetes bacterium]|nr:hypothetical protein [Bacteroidota bacterium]